MELVSNKNTIMNKSNFKILQLNKNNSDIHIRIPHINAILLSHKPQLFILNELNCSIYDKLSPTSFPSYSLEINNLYKLNYAKQKYRREKIPITSIFVEKYRI